MTSIQDLIDEKKIFTPAEAAKYLGIGKTVAYAMFREPGFPCFHIGRRKFVVWDDLYKWLIENKAVHPSGKEHEKNGPEE
ncbi:Helix-turn-helix domain-containing protein [Butyrivibrio sp. INlla18]|uniref:helix-turn-helix transcriptional regulator n=1 Tax=Butyrivibrio sp. INlla18 TaxID=1520806 RepID=UPI00088B510D|nr:helix-turn-helix domain-containing protein [Butyrivibrio sp. INlla18]SDA79063.1 Helix-turn-helix domain-containing protein [Butyrivibrio sp. INlla18]